MRRRNLVQHREDLDSFIVQVCSGPFGSLTIDFCSRPILSGEETRG